MAAEIDATFSPLSPFVLHGYRANDLDAMFALDALCFAKPFRFSRSEMRSFAEAPNANVIVAEAPGGASPIAGFSIVHLERGRAGRFGYLVTLDVAAEWRQRGLARRLLAVSEQNASGSGAAAMWLHVFTENDPALRLYESLGYARAGVEPRFYGAAGDAFVYRKSLAKN